MSAQTCDLDLAKYTAFCWEDDVTTRKQLADLLRLYKYTHGWNNPTLIEVRFQMRNQVAYK